MRSLIAPLTLGLALLTSSCFVEVHEDDDFDPGPARGELAVFWTFDGFRDCGPVYEVEVALVDPDGFIYDDARYWCTDQGIVYEELDEGWWSIDMTGIDAYGRVLYRGGADLFVAGNAYNEFDIDLAVR